MLYSKKIFLAVLAFNIMPLAAQADVTVVGGGGGVAIVQGRNHRVDDNNTTVINTAPSDTGTVTAIGRSAVQPDYSNVQVYGNSSGYNNDTYLMQNGRFVRATDGNYDLGNDSNVNVQDGRANGNIGTVQIRN